MFDDVDRENNNIYIFSLALTLLYGAKTFNNFIKHLRRLRYLILEGESKRDSEEREE